MPDTTAACSRIRREQMKLIGIQEQI